MTKFATSSGDFLTITWRDAASGGNVVSPPGPGEIAEMNGHTVTLNNDRTCLRVQNTAGGTFIIAAGVTYTGDVEAIGATCCTLNNGSRIAGTAFGNRTVNTGSRHGAVFAGTGTAWVDHAAGGGHAGGGNSGVEVTGSGTLNVINVSASQGGIGFQGGIRHAGTGIVNVSGIMTGAVSGGTNHTIVNVGSGTVNILSSATWAGATAGGPNHIISNQGGGTINIWGNPVGGAGGSGSHGVQNEGLGTVNIWGNPVGGLGGTGNFGVRNTGLGTVNIHGSATGGTGTNNHAAVNETTGILRVQLAIGGPHGVGTTGTGPALGVVGNGVTGTFVGAVQHGERGMSPTSGVITLDPSLTPTSANFFTITGTRRMAVAADSVGDYPIAANVRHGVNYAFGILTGSCHVPLPQQVAFGVPVNNTTGQAVLTPAQIPVAAGVSYQVREMAGGPPWDSVILTATSGNDPATTLTHETAGLSVVLAAGTTSTVLTGSNIENGLTLPPTTGRVGFRNIGNGNYLITIPSGLVLGNPISVTARLANHVFSRAIQHLSDIPGTLNGIGSTLGGVAGTVGYMDSRLPTSPAAVGSAMTLAPDSITATVIAANALNGRGDWATPTTVWNHATRTITAGGLDAAGVRAAIGLAAANLDTQISNLPSSVWGFTTRTITAGGLDAAGVRAAIGLSAANLDTQLTNLPGNTWNHTTRTITAGGIDAAGVRSAIGLSAANLDTQLASVSGAANSAASSAGQVHARLPASPAAVGSAMTLAPNAITAGSIATNALDAKGDWATADDVVFSGTGPHEVIIRTFSDTGPVGSVMVGLGEYRAVSDSTGTAVFHVESSEYQLLVARRGYSASPVTLNVNGNFFYDIHLMAIPVIQPSILSMCVVQAVVYRGGTPLAGATVFAKEVSGRMDAGVVDVLSLPPHTVMSGGDGLISMELVRGMMYEIWANNGAKQRVRIPDADNYILPAMQA